MSATTSRRSAAHEEEHENSERWLVSYADMMTLLMVLFIVMFAISAVDHKKFAALKDGLSSGFGATVNVPVTGGTGIRENDGVVPGMLNIGAGLAVAQQRRTGKDQTAYQEAAAGVGGKASATKAAARAEVKRLASVERRIKAALKARGLQGDVRFKLTERGLVVALVSDDVFFADASADIRPRGRQVLAAVAPVVRPLTQDVAVEGHANSLALRSAVYPSNWELSGARAASVVRWLVSNESITPHRLSATGYGSSRPLYRAGDPRSVRFNRRVDLVLVSDQPADVRALAARIAPELSNL